MWERHTLADWPATAGFNILAFKGIKSDLDRESQLSGFTDLVQQGRSNVNGIDAVVPVALTMGKLFGAIASLGLMVCLVSIEYFNANVLIAV